MAPKQDLALGGPRPPDRADLRTRLVAITTGLLAQHWQTLGITEADIRIAQTVVEGVLRRTEDLQLFVSCAHLLPPRHHATFLQLGADLFQCGPSRHEEDPTLPLLNAIADSRILYPPVPPPPRTRRRHPGRHLPPPTDTAQPWPLHFLESALAPELPRGRSTADDQEHSQMSRSRSPPPRRGPPLTAYAARPSRHQTPVEREGRRSGQYQHLSNLDNPPSQGARVNHTSRLPTGPEDRTSLEG